MISISWRAGAFAGGDGFSVKEIGAQCIIKYRLNDSDEEWLDFAYYYGGEDASVSVINQVCSTISSPSLGKTKTGVPEAFGESGKGLFIGGDAYGNSLMPSCYDSVWALVTGDAQYFGEPSDWFKPQVGSSFNWT